MARWLSTTEIATALSLLPSSVIAYTRSPYQRLRIHRGSELVGAALAVGEVDGPRAG